MRFLHDTVLNDASNSGTVNSAAVDTSYLEEMSAVVTFSDVAAAGTLKLQASNEQKSPVVWVDIPAATVTVAAGATSLLPRSLLCFMWVRAVWTSTGGAGTFTVNLKASGGGG
jgi:hypothetical protein